MVNNKNMNILVTGVGGPTPKGIAMSLKMANPTVRIVGVDSNKYAPGLYSDFSYDNSYIVENAQKDPIQYWRDIEKIVKLEKIDYAFVVPETELLVWCTRKNNTDDLPCKSFLPDFNVANFLFDKLKVGSYLEPFGLTPRTIKVDNLKIETTEKLKTDLKYPYWVRLNKTAGAIGALKINSSDDLLNWFNFIDFTNDVIASPFLPGRNYATKLLYEKGNLVLAASAERIEYLLSNASPTKISGMCSRGKLINSEELINRAKYGIELIFNKFDIIPHGMFTVDFKEDINNIPLITEINIRHVSFTHAFTLGGANFADKTLNILTGKDLISSKPIFIFEEEFNFLRGVDNELKIVKESDVDYLMNKLKSF